MEDPKTFSAPITAFNDTSVSNDKEPTSAAPGAKLESHQPDGEADTRQEADPSKSDDSAQGAESGSEKKEESKDNGDNKSLKETQDNAGLKDDGNSSDKIECTTKETDLEANVSASSQTSDSNHKKEDEAKDPNIVDWDGPDDLENPMNWPAWKINLHIFLVSSITFIRCVRYHQRSTSPSLAAKYVLSAL